MVLQRQLAATSEQIGSNNSSLTGQKGSIAAQIAQLEDQMRNFVITSPIQGTILTKYMEQGEFADQGKADRKEYSGTVTWISSKAEFTPKTIQTRDERANLVYAVKIAVKNDGLIKEGMYGDVKF